MKEGWIVPNKKSAAKRVRQSEKRRLRNKSKKTAFKNAVKKLVKAMEEGKDREEVMKLYRRAQSLIMRASKKGAIHRNTASRKISRLSSKVNEYLVKSESVGASE